MLQNGYAGNDETKVLMTEVRTRADMCPGVLRPWRADDGLLVRIRLIGGRGPTTALRRLSEVSHEYADGRIFVTRRANLQLRGMSGDGGQLTTGALEALESTGLLPSRTHEFVRNVLVSPQTGLAGGRADLRPVADELDALICADPELGLLPGRFLFALDDGRGDILDRLTGAGKRGTDLGLVALDEDTVQLRVGDHWGVVTSLRGSARGLVDLARQFLDVRGTGVSAAWHVRELTHPLQPAVPADRRIPAPAAPLAYGTVAGGVHVPVADGVLTQRGAQALLQQASAVTHLVVTPWRGILIPNASEGAE
jgi:precorrin-3B synthase